MAQIIKELRDKQAKLVSDARAKRDEIAADTPAARAAEIEGEFDAMMAEFDKIEERIGREQRLAEREAALSQPDPRRPQGENRTSAPGKDKVDPKVVFRRAMQFGVAALPEEERAMMVQLLTDVGPESRALAAGTPAAGGYTVPEGFMSEIDTALKAYGPMLDPGVTRQVTTVTGNALPWPTVDDTANIGALITENTQVTDQDVAFGQKSLDAYLYTSKVVKVSNVLLQDSAFNLEAEVLRPAFGERIGRAVNQHLTVGTGTAQPNGIVTASPKGADAVAAAAISFDDMIELEHGVDPAYRSDPSCRWMFADGTLKLIRKLKDTEGQYIWQMADVRTGAPAAILGHPYSVNQDMPAVAASQKSVIFGAFNKYVVRRVREMVMMRLVERYADYFQTGFVAFARYDGELIASGAVKHLLHPAS